MEPPKEPTPVKVKTEPDVVPTTSTYKSPDIPSTSSAPDPGTVEDVTTSDSSNISVNR